MGSLLRLTAGAGLFALAFLAITVGLANSAGPVHLILALFVIALYLVPSGLALHRDCEAAWWIVTLNILLAWTLFGWVIALGWAATGKEAVPQPPPPVRQIAGR